MIIEAVINLAITIAAAYLCCYIRFCKSNLSKSRHDWRN